MSSDIIAQPSKNATKEYNLKVVSPDVASQWDYEKNSISPDKVSPGSHKKAWWRCDIGHSWSAVIKSRSISGRGCPYCSGKKVLAGFNDLASLHPDIASEWNFEKNELTPQEVTKNSGKKVWWKCKYGHEWEAKPLSRVSGGTGCPYCSGNNVIVGEADLASRFPDLVEEWDYEKNDISPSSYSYGSRKKVWWICGKKGHSFQSAIYHRSINKSGCPVCAGQKIVTGDNDIATLFPLLSQEWDAEKNASLTPQDVTASSTKRVWWVCKNGHSWKALVSDRTRGSGCPKCAKRVSKMEVEVFNFIRSILPEEIEVVTSDRSLLRTHELDIFVPDLNIAVEFNGTYWHGEKMGRGRDSHLSKWEKCNSKGVQLIAVWEDDWVLRRPIVESMIIHKLGFSNEKKVFARNTSITRVDSRIASEFLDDHHIQGSSLCSAYFGLADKNGEIIAVSAWRKNRDILYLDRYATSCIVVGGMGKLLKEGASYAQENGIMKIVTFSDNSVSDGSLYQDLGFSFDGDVKPDYKYRIGMERKHKFGYRISRFKNDPLLQYEEGLTESQLAELNGLDRVWDYGKKRWVMKI